ncbi:MAG: hypothetical protein MZV63_11245 [Marinilabiliales bacterium]|nr:hypothetical protein [Marinilabiliales bacterium]
MDPAYRNGTGTPAVYPDELCPSRPWCDPSFFQILAVIAVSIAPVTFISSLVFVRISGLPLTQPAYHHREKASVPRLQGQ